MAFQEGLKETEKENIWMAVEKNDKNKKENLKEKGRDINYAERRSMLQKSLELWDCCCKWAIPQKIQTGGVEDMEFPRVLKKIHVEIPGVN